MMTTTTIVLISGSPTSPSRTLALLHYMAERIAIEQPTWKADLLNVRDLDAAELIHGRWDGPSVKEAVARIATAAAVVVATPVYKAAYTGVLKTLLDVLPNGALAGKAVLPIAIGGSMAHSLVIDYALRPVLMALGAQLVLPGLYYVDKELEMADGRLAEFAGDGAGRSQTAVQSLLHAVEATNPQ